MPYYRCPSCGLTSYSAACYSTVAECPTCGTSLRSGSNVLAPALSTAMRSFNATRVDGRGSPRGREVIGMTNNREALMSTGSALPRVPAPVPRFRARYPATALSVRVIRGEVEAVARECGLAGEALG